jgi:hypothetical protein
MCQVCQMENVANIDSALRMHVGHRVIAARFGLTKSAVTRHSKHVEVPLRPAPEPRVSAVVRYAKRQMGDQNIDVVAELAWLRDEAHQAHEDAGDKIDLRLRAQARLAACLELVARFTELHNGAMQAMIASGKRQGMLERFADDPVGGLKFVRDIVIPALEKEIAKEGGAEH